MGYSLPSPASSAAAEPVTAFSQLDRAALMLATIILLVALIALMPAPRPHGGRALGGSSSAAGVDPAGVPAASATPTAHGLDVAPTVGPALSRQDSAAASSPDAQEAPPAPAPTPAPQAEATTPACDLGCRERRILDGISISLPEGWQVSVEPGRTGVLGSADPSDRVVRVYVREGWSDTAMRYVLLHEYGHAYDFTSLDDEQRARWMRQRGIASQPWNPGCRGSLTCSDRTSPAGDWAESFAYCHTHLTSLFRAELVGLPSGGDCRLLTSLVSIGTDS